MRKLHALRPQTEAVYPLDELIGAWQARYAAAKGTLARYFTAGELARIDALMMRQMPDTLRALGEKRVFSRGDLGDGNILIDGEGRAGVIDFSDPGYMDEASDLMDITGDALCAAILDAYGADEVLRKKVAMQRRIRPVFVLDVYAQRGEAAVQKLIRRIRQELGREA